MCSAPHLLGYHLHTTRRVKFHSSGTQHMQVDGAARQVQATILSDETQVVRDHQSRVCASHAELLVDRQRLCGRTMPETKLAAKRSRIKWRPSNRHSSSHPPFLPACLPSGVVVVVCSRLVDSVMPMINIIQPADGAKEPFNFLFSSSFSQLARVTSDTIFK